VSDKNDGAQPKIRRRDTAPDRANKGSYAALSPDGGERSARAVSSPAISLTAAHAMWEISPA